MKIEELKKRTYSQEFLKKWFITIYKDNTRTYTYKFRWLSYVSYRLVYRKILDYLTLN